MFWISLILIACIGWALYELVTDYCAPTLSQKMHQVIKTREKDMA